MRYVVTAMSGSADVVRLRLDAGSSGEAGRAAAERGLRVLSISRALGWDLRLRGARREFPLVAFSQELASLLTAGISLVEALQTLAEKETRGDVRSTLNGVIAALSSGQPFSAALRGEAAAFSPLFIATVKASERTGDLVESLSRFVAWRTQIDAVRKKIVGACIYPLLLLGVGALVTLFLLAYVVPRFASVYESAGRELPWLSQLLLSWGRFFEAHWMWVLLGAVAALAATVHAGASAALRSRLMDALWRVPAIGERMRVYELARLYRTLGMLLGSGMPMVAALTTCGELLPPQLRSRLHAAVEALSTGVPISTALQAHGLTTAVALRMLRVGERTGRIGELMVRIASFHEEELARTVEWFMRLFEPVLMLVIGAAIGFIVVLMYLPVFELAGSLQ